MYLLFDMTPTNYSLTVIFCREILTTLIQERNVLLLVILRKRTFNSLVLETVTIVKMSVRMILKSSIFQSGFLSP